jgi:hypothetical protein
MKFNLVYGNHGGITPIEDVIVYLRNALMIGGYEAAINEWVDPAAINVLIENFSDGHCKAINDFYASGTKVIVVVSEFTDGTGFNPHISGPEGHYSNAPYWRARFAAFMKMLPSISAIWTLSPYTVAQYQAFLPDLPVCEFPVGYDRLWWEKDFPGLERHKTIDVLFTGNATPHRLAVMEEIRRHCWTIFLPASTPNVERVGYTRRARVSLHIGLEKNARYGSLMRLHFLLMNGVATASEGSQNPTALDEFVEIYEGDEFVDRVVDLVNSGQWEGMGLAAHSRYAAARPLEPAVRRLVEASGF